MFGNNRLLSKRFTPDSIVSCYSKFATLLQENARLKIKTVIIASVHLNLLRIVLNVCCDIDTNSEDPEEMPKNAAFHQGLHCLLKQKQSSEKEMQIYFEIITCDPLMYTMDLPQSIVSIQKEEFITA